jgi:uncharacterized metal-binding protein YceD (DUF177 family)
VEDEIILALPYSPRHDDGQCRPGGASPAKDEPETAFAKLATLKRDLN